MKIYYNVGIASTSLVSLGYKEVWFHPKGIAFILSLSRLKKKYIVKFGSVNGNKFILDKNTEQKILRIQRIIILISWGMIRKQNE